MKNRIIARVKQLRAQGETFRGIEARMPKSLGLKRPGNGTKAFRLLEAN